VAKGAEVSAPFLFLVFVLGVIRFMSNNSQVKNVPINFSGSGDNVVVTAVAGKQIKVVRMYFVVGGATSITFKDGVNGVAFSGAMSLLANGSVTFDYNDNLIWFSTTSSNNAFVINSSNAVQVSGEIYYILE
jgi:hypothetical protein